MSRTEVVNEVEMLVKGEAEKGAYHHVIKLLFQENVSVTVGTVNRSLNKLLSSSQPHFLPSSLPLNMKFLKTAKDKQRDLAKGEKYLCLDGTPVSTCPQLVTSPP
jgi:hypothetical protein